ncbi:MAG: M28 family peptidase [Bdellovibrionales bacterium]|nr:M28 family peptidase [Bdellovibrionales bacterium]
MRSVLFTSCLLSSLLLLVGVSFQTSTVVLDEIAQLTYEGRGVGTQGLNEARDFLVSKFKQNGLFGGLDDQGYEQNVSVFLNNRLGEKNNLSFSEDFIPLAISRSGDLKEKDLVFVGYGISYRSGESIIYDDYEGIDVKGKIVVAMFGDPAIGNPDSAFKDPSLYHYSQSLYKAQNAALHGAEGLLLVRSPLSFPEGQEEPKLEFNGRQGGGTVFDLVVGQTTIKAINGILKDRNLLSVQREIAQTQKPKSFIIQQSASMEIDLVREIGNVQNIVVKKIGEDPVLKDEFIVVGAHYDHLGYGFENSTDPHGAGKIHPGADDNASGTEAVFQIAKWAKGIKTSRSLLFVLFSAEEVGLVGSSHFVENLPIAENQKVVAMLNLDMVGRMSDDKLYVMGSDTAFEFKDVMDNIDLQDSLNVEILNSANGNSDHAPFWDQKIPALFFTTGGHEDYHKPSDTVEKINREGLLKVVRYAEKVVDKISSVDQSLTYNPESERNRQRNPNENRGYGVLFGSRPQMPQPDNIHGVLLAGVREDTPASRSGLQGGDILIGIGEIEVNNLYDFVFALRYFRPGDKVIIRWVREDSIMQGETILLQRENSFLANDELLY